MIIKHNKKRNAFTMIELIFVIVVMGIIGKFGVEFLAQAYRSFISTNVNHTLQSNSASAVEFVATRLQHRIKASTIARETNASINPPFSLLSDYYNGTAPILEWIAVDVDGFRGDTLPFWSGVIDLNQSISDNTQLFSPATDTSEVDTLIQALSGAGAIQNDMALYFVDPDAIPTADNWGWDANTTRFDTQTDVYIHPVRRNGGNNQQFLPVTSNPAVGNSFSGVTAYEYYQLAWTAYAVGINDWNPGTGTGTLTLWYDYQPWKGDTYLLQADGSSTKSAVIMEDVSSFRFIASEAVVKIQVCVKSMIIDGNADDGGYSICKEKTVF